MFHSPTDAAPQFLYVQEIWFKFMLTCLSVLHVQHVQQREFNQLVAKFDWLFFSSKEKKVVQDISGSYHHNGRIMYARAIAEQFQLDWPR